jgi:hypothetical protein
LRYCTTSPKVAVSIPVGSLGFFIDLIFWPYYGSGVNLTSNRNEYQAYFLGVKVASDNFTTFMYRLPRNSASLNLLEPKTSVKYMHVWKRGEVHTGFRCGRSERKKQLGRPRLRRDKNIIKRGLQEEG